MPTRIAYDEIELISAFQRGDRKALHHIYTLFQQSLCFFTEQLIADTMAAEDIVSECFISAFQRKEDFPSLGQLKSFLFTAAKNAALNYIKAQKRHDDIHHSIERGAERFSIDVENAYIKTEVLQFISGEIEKLPPQCRQVVHLAIIEGKSAPEIAAELNISRNTVKEHLRRAIANIKTWLEMRLAIAIILLSQL